MKPLAVVAIILLPFSANTWAAEELPIELTCEIGAVIVYFHITGNPETTWYQNHRWNFGQRSAYIFDYEMYPDRNEVNDVFIAENSIFIGIWPRRSGKVYINRLTGGLMSNYTEHDNAGYITGHCTEGFKEYENNLF